MHPNSQHRRTRHIYIATRLGRAGDARDLAHSLAELGYGIASTWHDQRLSRENESALSHKEAHEIRRQNLGAIRIASVFICLADPQCRGTLVEIEYAHQHALNDARTMICVGEPRVLGPMSAILWDHVLIYDTTHAGIAREIHRRLCEEDMP